MRTKLVTNNTIFKQVSQYSGCDIICIKDKDINNKINKLQNKFGVVIITLKNRRLKIRR